MTTNNTLTIWARLAAAETLMTALRDDPALHSPAVTNYIGASIAKAARHLHPQNAHRTSSSYTPNSTRTHITNPTGGDTTNTPPSSEDTTAFTNAATSLLRDLVEGGDENSEPADHHVKGDPDCGNVTAFPEGLESLTARELKFVTGMRKLLADFPNAGDHFLDGFLKGRADIRRDLGDASPW